MPERAYLSIGEVLALLKDEFTDITISKIRFLESQGLIDPERTPSGYRKFYEPDVERLRWILRQQKEHYLPLRVIKGKLSGAPTGEEAAEEQVRSAPPVLTAVPDPPEEPPAPERGGGADVEEPPPAVAEAVEAAEPPEVAAPPAGTEPGPADRPVAVGRAASRSAPPFPASLRRSARSSPAAHLSAPEPPRHLRPPPVPPPPADPPAEPAPPAEPDPPAPAPRALPFQDGRTARAATLAPPGPAEDLDLDPDEAVELTAEELGIVAGLTPLAVAELERYGLITGQRSPGGRYYDAAALEIAHLAAAFAHFGVEPRHLRMWKTAAEREADFYEQVVTPLRSQRSNKARRQAGETVVELADLGARLHVALVTGTLKRLT